MSANTMYAASKAAFDQEAKGLPWGGDLGAEIVRIEPITGAYFSDASRQRCIVRQDGKLFLAYYD
jgi:hypothetical protein